MTKHPTEITKYDGSLSELVEDISNLRYDILVEFFNMLYLKISLDGLNDVTNTRFQLGRKLARVAVKLKAVSDDFEKIWNLCKKYMKIDN